MPYLFHHLVKSSQTRFPQRIALQHKQQQLSYTELQYNIELITNQLMSLGLSTQNTKQDRVAIYLGKCIESIISFYAISACGAIFVPINPHLKNRQVGHILNDCTAKILITSSQRFQQLLLSSQNSLSTILKSIEHVILIGYNSTLPTTPIQQHLWSSMIKQAKKFRNNQAAEINETDTVAILYTSGSTGKAKGVVLSHKNLVCGAESVTSYLKNHSEDKILALLPFSFDYGLNQLTTACYSGACLVLIEYLLPQDIINAVSRYQITGLAAVPPLWIQLAKLKWPEQSTHTLRYFTSSGGVMPAKTLTQLRQLLPHSKPFLMYGLTEAFRSTCLEPEFIDTHPGSIGKAIPNAEILIVNNKGKLCAEDEIGELVHRGPLVAKGYWNNQIASARVFRPIKSVLPRQSAREIAVWSGDLVKYDADGFIYFIERSDEMIKTSGYRISPTEVEEVFQQHENIVNAIAIGVPHFELGQAILLICIVNSIISADQLKLYAKNYLPAFMCPKDVIIETELQHTANGKIDRQALKKQYINTYNN